MGPGQKQQIVFYHKHCVDGAASAWAAYKALGERADYFPLDHTPEADKQIEEQAAGHEYLYFSDYSPSRERLEKLLDEGKKVFVLDHHITAVRNIESVRHKHFVPRFDLERSGASITWDYFHNEANRPIYINYIEALDLHRTDYPNFWDASSFFDQFQWNTFDDVLKHFPKIEKKSINDCLDEGRVIKEAKRTLIDHLLEKTVYADVFGYKVPTINTTYFWLRELNEEAPSLAPDSFSIVWNVVEDGQVRCSLRTKSDNIDVSLIAAELAGGGGHRKASGCRFENIEQFLEKVKLYDSVPGKNLPNSVQNSSRTG